MDKIVNASSNQLISYSLIGSIFMFVYADLKKILGGTFQFFMDMFTCQLVINAKGNEKSTYAINEELKKKYDNKIKIYNVTDGHTIPNYKIAPGNYYITYNKTTIYINTGEDKIEMWAYFTPISTLKSFIEDVYKEYITTDNVILFYTNELSEWSTPIFRRPRNIINTTPSMNTFLDDVKIFLSNDEEQKYEDAGRPYRKGYLIEGVTGTGKSTVIEKIAIEHNMSIYTIIFNSEKMTGAVLNKLIATVPMRSIIVFDEMEKQYATVRANPNSQISDGDILLALDGVQRLSHGTIVVLLANDVTLLPTTFKTPLLRPGRIDKSFTFTELLT